MPVGFLNKTQQAQLSSFPSTINYNDLITYFTLTDQDKFTVPMRSSAANRLGFAIQLCALRFMGFFIKDMNLVPLAIIGFLTEQLDLNEVPDLGRYGQRPQTRTDHIKAVEKYLGFRPADKRYGKRIQAWLVNRALEHDRPILLFQLTAEKMKQDKRTRFSLWKMEKLISHAREKARLIIYESLEKYLTEDPKGNHSAIGRQSFGLFCSTFQLHTKIFASVLGDIGLSLPTREWQANKKHLHPAICHQ